MRFELWTLRIIFYQFHKVHMLYMYSIIYGYIRYNYIYDEPYVFLFFLMETGKHFAPESQNPASDSTAEIAKYISVTSDGKADKSSCNRASSVAFRKRMQIPSRFSTARTAIFAIWIQKRWTCSHSMRGGGPKRAWNGMKKSQGRFCKFNAWRFWCTIMRNTSEFSRRDLLERSLGQVCKSGLWASSIIPVRDLSVRDLCTRTLASISTQTLLVRSVWENVRDVYERFHGVIYDQNTKAAWGLSDWPRLFYKIKRAGDVQ